MSVGNVRYAPGARSAWHARMSKPLPGLAAPGMFIVWSATDPERELLATTDLHRRRRTGSDRATKDADFRNSHC